MGDGTYTPPDISDIRTALGEITAVEIPDSTIEQAIGDADRKVTARLSDPDTVPAVDRQFAVREWAAYRAWTALPQESQRAAVDASASFNVESYTKRLKDRRDSALADLPSDATKGGASAAFFTSSKSVFDQ